MLIGIISGPTFHQAIKQVEKAEKNSCKGLELRLDLLENVSFEKISYLKNRSSLLWIFTLKSQRQGGI